MQSLFEANRKKGSCREKERGPDGKGEGETSREKVLPVFI